MKDYAAGVIFCRCSTRMHTKDKLIQVYENTSEKKKCPNCGKMRRVMVGG